VIQRIGDVGIAGDQRVELLGDLGLVEPALGNVEIEPAVAIADRAAGHRIGQDDAEQMQRGVDAHALQPLLPVQHDCDGLAGLRRGLSFQGNMEDAALVLGIVDRRADRDLAAVARLSLPAIAGLPAAGGIEHGAIEDDAAALVHGLDGRWASVR
jgi:hypothetical protein